MAGTQLEARITFQNTTLVRLLPEIACRAPIDGNRRILRRKAHESRELTRMICGLDLNSQS